MAEPIRPDVVWMQKPIDTDPHNHSAYTDGCIVGMDGDRLERARRLHVEVVRTRDENEALRAEIGSLRAALRQILDDPTAHIRESHRGDGWAALR